MDELTPGWRCFHFGSEGDEVQLVGIRLWEVDWGRPLGSVTVAHPHYPSQRHKIWVYGITVQGLEVRFAAGEFSNGAWGFFEPTAAAPTGRA